MRIVNAKKMLQILMTKTTRNNPGSLLPVKPKGLFFINSMESKTTASAIECLCQNELQTPFAFYQVASPREFIKKIDEWGDLNRVAYSVLFINSHGTPGFLHLLKGKVSMSQIASVLAGNAAGRWVHMSACATLANESYHKFALQSGAYGVSGFAKDINQFDSLSLEIQLLKQLWTTDVRQNFRAEVPIHALKNSAYNLANDTGFVVHQQWQ